MNSQRTELQKWVDVRNWRSLSTSYQPTHGFQIENEAAKAQSIKLS
jgi:hypothetical protein